MALYIHKSTNLNYSRALLKWYTIEEQLILKMILFYKQIKNIRKDHRTKRRLGGKSLIEFWETYSKVGNYLINKYKNDTKENLKVQLWI